MATISLTLPASTANFLNLNVPGFAAASGGGSTLALEVPASALPAPVVAGLNDAGIQVTSAAAPVVPVAVPNAPAAWHWDFAPAAGGLVPQSAAHADPNLAVANAFVHDLAQYGGAAVNAFFQAAAANPFPADPSQIGAWVAHQQQAVHDYLLGA